MAHTSQPTSPPSPTQASQGSEGRGVPVSCFALAGELIAKADPALIATDQAHFDRITTVLEDQRAVLSSRLEQWRREPITEGHGAMDRDLEIHRLTGRLAVLKRFGIDLVLGRMSPLQGDPVWIGRIGLVDDQGAALVVDWRTPAAAPFFAATLADPQGLSSRRRYRWDQGLVVDYSDEVLTSGSQLSSASHDHQSAFIASLGEARGDQMRDVLATIAADQDAIIREPGEGVVVVDGGPGTGKTVVALHRAAHLMYADQRMASHRGGVLFIGPHHRYLSYVADILPNLGEVGVQVATLADLVPQGATAASEPDRQVRELKLSAALTAVVDPAVALYEEAPADVLELETQAGPVEVGPLDWADAFATADPGVGHHEARDQIWDELLDLLVDRFDPDDLDAAELEAADVRAELAADEDLRTTFSRAWPILDPADLVADLWAVPAYLRRCAPELTAAQRALLRRPEGQPWTDADLPLLDAMTHRLGDPRVGAHRRRLELALAQNRAAMDQVVDRLLDDTLDADSPLHLLRRQSIRQDLLDDDVVTPLDRDRLAGPFAHVIVDEAQELSPAQWQMLIRRCPSRSITVVGDRAQARRGLGRDWDARLAEVGLPTPRVRTLSVNYRTPAEVMAVAAPVIRAVAPQVTVPVSVRHSGHQVRTVARSELGQVISTWSDGGRGVAAIVGPEGADLATLRQEYANTARLAVLTPEGAKGLEFDLVVLLGDEVHQDPIEAAVDRYVAMTRTTDSLVLVE